MWLPPNLADSRARDENFLFKTILSNQRNFALLYFTVIIVEKEVINGAEILLSQESQSTNLLDFYGQQLAIGPTLPSHQVDVPYRRHIR